MKIAAQILAIQQATPTIKTLTLKLEDPAFTFMPGQWVDCYVEIDGRQEVAGYSLTSSPLTRGTIDLAVKREGDNRVTRYVHEKAGVGDRLEVELDGDFYYERDMADSLVLIAGGIGINPIMSIMRYMDKEASDVRATLLYGVRTPSELLFGDQLVEIASRNDGVRCIFTVTRPSDEPWDGRVGRIDGRMLREEGIDLEALFYLCGPPPMMRDMLALLDELGVPKPRIKYEWWWDPDGQRVPRGEGHRG